MLLTLDEGYLTTALPDLQRGIAPLGPPVPIQPWLLGRGVGPPGHPRDIYTLTHKICNYVLLLGKRTFQK